MGQRNQLDQDVRVREVFVECTEKTEFPGFGFSGQGDRRALQGRRRLPEEKCYLQDHGMAARFILNGTWKSKMEILVYICCPAVYSSCGEKPDGKEMAHAKNVRENDRGVIAFSGPGVPGVGSPTGEEAA